MLSSTLMNSLQFWTGSNFDECFRYACSNSRRSTLMQLLFSFDRGMRVEKTLASLSSRSYLVTHFLAYFPTKSIHSFPVWRLHFHLGRSSAERTFCKMWLADTNFPSEKNFEQKKMFNFWQWYFRKIFCARKIFLSGNEPLFPLPTLRGFAPRPP